jgi:hypothetical protein
LARVLPKISLVGSEISPVVLYIIFFAATTGVYTIYGGLKPAAWTDFMQIILLFAGVISAILDRGGRSAQVKAPIWILKLVLIWILEFGFWCLPMAGS